MLRKIITPLFATIFGLMSFSAQAGIDKGDKSFGINAQLISEDTEDTLMILANMGMFTSETLELQGVVMFMDAGPMMMVGLGANANLYFPKAESDFIPYVGGGGQIISIDIDGSAGAPGIKETELAFNVQAGFKQFIDEDIAVNYQLQVISSDNYDATIASVGLTIFLD